MSYDERDYELPITAGCTLSVVVGAFFWLLFFLMGGWELLKVLFGV